jgi:ketosteroid isomerase-like protein
MNPDQQKIRQAIEGFVEAYNQGDVDTLLAVYTEDCVDMSEGQPTLVGDQVRQDTKARLNDTFTKFTGHLTVEVDEIEVAGDCAFDRGTLRLELRPKAEGQPVLVERRFIEIWRRGQDGEWRVARCIDNSAAPKQQSLDFRG